MRKCSKYFLLISLFFIPISVFASSGNGSNAFSNAIVIEIIISIFISVLVFMPISNIFSENNSKKLFWKLFIIRAVILFLGDLFIPTLTVIFDFLSIYLGQVILPLLKSAHKKKLYSNYKMLPDTTKANTKTCSKCGNILKPSDKFCFVCGTSCEEPLTQKKILVNYSNFDPIFNNTDDKLLEEFINRELVKAGVKKGLTFKTFLVRKNILNVIFSVLLFVYTSLIFFHFPLYTYVIGAIILFIYFIVYKKYNLIKYLKREVLARPNEKISNIVMGINGSVVSDYSILFQLGVMLVAVISSLVVFYKPRILYEKTDGGYAVRFYTFGLSNYKTAVIPSTYKGEKVVSLRGNTFSNMPYLESVELPNTIVEIRGQAFKNDSNLVSVNIPSNLKYLGGGAFYGCSSITSIILPDTLTYMGGEVFYKAVSLKSIKLSENLTEIRGDSFEYCTSLKSIVIPDNIERIGGHAFYGDSSLSEVTLTANSKLREIGSSAFRRCSNLYSITIPFTTYVNERAFKESPTFIKYFYDFDF